MNMDILKSHAADLLEIALRNDSMDLYLFPSGIFKIEIKDPTGNDASDHFIKMEAIYDYYRAHQDQDLVRKVFDVLNKYTQKARADWGFLYFLRIVEHQIVAEAEARAPFRLDIDALLGNLTRNLKDNKALYASDAYDRKGFMEEIRRHHRRLSENYGYMLLSDDEQSR